MYAHDTYAARPWSDTPAAIAFYLVSGVQWTTARWDRSFRTQSRTPSAFTSQAWTSGFSTNPWASSLFTPEWERNLP